MGMTWARGMTKGTGNGGYYFGNEKKKPDPYNEETAALIDEWKRLYELPFSELVLDYKEHWERLTYLGIATYEHKCEFLSGLADKVQKHSGSCEAELIMLMLIMTPIRHKIGKIYVQKLKALQPQNVLGADRKNLKILHEAYMERNLDRSEIKELFDDFDLLAVELVLNYRPSKCGGNWFGYFSAFFEARAAEIFRTKYVQRYLSECPVDFEELSTKEFLNLAEYEGYRKWHQDLANNEDLPWIFGIVKKYESSHSLKKICRDAIGRLPFKQRETIDAVYYHNENSIEIAKTQGVADSTVRRNHQNGLRNLRKDEEFTQSVVHVGAVRRGALTEPISYESNYNDNDSNNS